jgi:AraC family transcriptional regulator
MRYEGSNEQGEIPAMWEEFLPRTGELDSVGAQGDPGAYGVSRELPGFGHERFEYLAAVPVKSTEDLPEGMVGWEIPAHTYAVFPANGVPDLMRVIGYVYSEWLPNSKEWEGAGNMMLELYPPSFAADHVIYLHFPVKAKEGR